MKNLFLVAVTAALAGGIGYFFANNKRANQKLLKGVKSLSKSGKRDE